MYFCPNCRTLIGFGTQWYPSRGRHIEGTSCNRGRALQNPSPSKPAVFERGVLPFGRLRVKALAAGSAQLPRRGPARAPPISSDLAGLVYSLPTTWASTWDIWSWGLNSTILTASSTTTV